MWESLSLREKIGQTVITLCTPEEHIKKCGSIKNFVEKYPIGGLFNSGKMVKGLLTQQNVGFKKVVDEYNKYSKIPLFATDDMENGTDKEGMKLFPHQMSLGAANDEELAYEYGKTIGAEALKCGVNWMFAPNTDINLSADSPVINTRALSDNYELNIKLALQILEGIRDAGVISTVKHYPGTDVNEKIDPHITLSKNCMTKKQWDTTYRKLYSEIIKSGFAPTFMTGHTNLPCYQKDTSYPPATLSEELVGKLLKTNLKFEGVVVTDALVMGGFTGSMAADNAIKSFMAGNDVLLWPSLDYIDEMERHILNGVISVSRLDDAVGRICKLKKQYGIIDKENKGVSYSAKKAEKLLEKISEKSITVINNRLLPLKKNSIHKVLIIGVTPSDDEYNMLSKLIESFESWEVKADMRRNIWTDELESVQYNYDLILFALCRQPHMPIGPLEFWGEEATTIWASNVSNADKTIVVSFGSPYLYKYYKETQLTYINAYSPVESVIKAVVAGLMGKFEFAGKSPVRL